MIREFDINDGELQFEEFAAMWTSGDPLPAGSAGRRRAPASSPAAATASSPARLMLPAASEDRRRARVAKRPLHLMIGFALTRKGQDCGADVEVGWCEHGHDRPRGVDHAGA